MRPKRGDNQLEDRASELGDTDPPPDDETSVWERIGRAATIAPVLGDPSLDPADDPWDVATMAGWGDVREDGSGHDAMMGVGQMATGEADAMAELDVDSATDGGPMELADDESIIGYSGYEPDDNEPSDTGWLSLGSSERMDWTTHL
jgi:hypothetical protein